MKSECVSSKYHPNVGRKRRIMKFLAFMMHLIKSDAWYGRLLQESVGLGGIKFWTVKESNKLFEQAGFKVSQQLVRGIVCFTKLVPN